jgi:hypothetical protein
VGPDNCSSDAAQKKQGCRKIDLILKISAQFQPRTRFLAESCHEPKLLKRVPHPCPATWGTEWGF